MNDRNLGSVIESRLFHTKLWYVSRLRSAALDSNRSRADGRFRQGHAAPLLSSAIEGRHNLDRGSHSVSDRQRLYYSDIRVSSRPYPCSHPCIAVRGLDFFRNSGSIQASYHKVLFGGQLCPTSVLQRFLACGTLDFAVRFAPCFGHLLAVSSIHRTSEVHRLGQMTRQPNRVTR